MTDSPRRRDRIVGLDVLRGLAALSVLAFHFTTRFGIIFGHPTAPWVSFPWGVRGVEVFFVISGFAIELSLASAPSAGRFLTSRAVRLYPTFWASLAVTFTVVSVFGLPERAVSLRDALANVTMIPASLGAETVDAVYWTLERELRFYGLVALLLAVGLRQYTTHVLVGLVALQTAVAGWPSVPHVVSDLANLGWVHLFACGALLARHHREPSRWTVFWVVLCVLASRRLGSMQFAYGAASAGLVWLASRPLSRWRLAPLVFLGKISYPLYLVHQYVGYVVMRALYAHGVSPTLTILSASAIGLGLATALHLVVEQPCLALLRRRRSAAHQTAPA